MVIQNGDSARGFWVQAGTPQTTGGYDPEDQTLEEAIETVFSMTSESAILFWDYVPVPIGYKYDFGDIAQDLVVLLESIMSEGRGEAEVRWGSSTFNAEWQAKWSAESLELAARWFDVVGGTEELLNAKTGFVVSKSRFMGEWKRPLCVILAALIECGYTSRDAPWLARLERLVERLPENSKLYSPGAERS